MKFILVALVVAFTVGIALPSFADDSEFWIGKGGEKLPQEELLAEVQNIQRNLEPLRDKVFLSPSSQKTIAK